MTTTSTASATDLPAERRPGVLPGGTVAAVAGPVLLAATNALVAVLASRVPIGGAADAVRQAAENPVLTEVVAALGLAAVFLLVPAVWAVSLRLAERTPRLAAVGGWLMATGYVASVVLSSEPLVALAVARQGGDASVFAAAVDQHTSLVSGVLYGVLGIGALLGGLVLGVAMLRQRDVVPVWAGVALLASEPVRVVGLVGPVPPLPAVASLLVAVAFGAVLLRGTRRWSPRR